MSLLEQDIIKKSHVDKTFQPELDNGDNEEYKVQAIHNSEAYIKVSDIGHLS